MDIEASQLSTCLDALETKEASLLAWGDCDGFFSEDEVLTTIEEVLPGFDPVDVKFELMDRTMLFAVPHEDDITVYRTRMGEAVHLYRNLRQWFFNQPLEHTRPLVSDYRFIRRPRSYPKREIDPNTLLLECKNELKLNDTVLCALTQMVSPLDRFRLSGFQIRSTVRISKAWQFHSVKKQGLAQPTGTIVCAGTGSGKTLSFYLPGLANLAGDICANAEERVRILAIYPRNELLKDQFMETWSQCRKLDALMLNKAGRKIKIGAYFGDTLYDVKNAEQKLKNASSIPFDLLRCTNPNCRGTMVWKKNDLDKGVQELSCSSCSHTVKVDEVGLTRKELSDHPPDILFTTTEMLNQHLGNNYQNHLFGVGYNVQGPTLVLLDEVHTYGGNTGAQTSFLLRRWMQRAWCKPHFVGLSATLSDAQAFFAQLIGADQSRVELVEPKYEEMEERCAEYLLALRGDPVSQTALLSTTIQASMLTRRVLDPIGQGRSDGCWGNKSFIFTDDLDVTNRLYHQLNDAEGWKTTWRGRIPNSPPLASLRGSDFNPHKIQLGQNWRMSQDIGHSLSDEDRAIVARTSSQDIGVETNAEMVVATASLEVGFNDPQVGAVIQHKAPQGVSSYLQRKGRAGRPPDMRPWMIVVLSEFGRDRVAFQRYEDLISPEIKRQGLPIHNTHIQKMQAAMATLDWLSWRLGKSTSIWNLLKNPGSKPQQCADLIKLVKTILEPGESQENYFSYLGWALGLNKREIIRVLWTTPRAVMLEFLPTLLRNLVTQWREFGQPWLGLPKNRSPIPEFIPEALFSKLNLPTLNIFLQRGRNNELTLENLTFFQGLREFAPGRISKRYAIDSNYDADWVLPDEFKPGVNGIHQVPFEVHQAFGVSFVIEGELKTPDGDIIKVIQPKDIYTKQLDKRFNLTEKSNAFLKWFVSFQCSNDEVARYKPPLGPWQKRLLDVVFYCHEQMTPLEVTRYNTGSLAALRFRGGDQAYIHFDWKMNGQDVGVGDRHWVDGIRFRFSMPKEVLMDLQNKPSVLRALRPVYFYYSVGRLNTFENDLFTANWIAECFLAALSNELDAFRGLKLSPEDLIQKGLAALKSEEGLNRLISIPLSLFQPDEQQSGGADSLCAKLASLLSDPMLVNAVHECADSLWQHPDIIEGFADWIRLVLGNTMAGVVQQMLYVLLPDVEERAALSDSIWDDEILEVWVTETEGGGSGIIDRLRRLYTEDSIYVLNVLLRCLEPSDYEQIDYDLFALLQILEQDEDLKKSFEKVRTAKAYKDRRQAIFNMRNRLKEEGFALSHTFMSVLFSRILKPGSHAGTDTALLRLLSRWNDLETETGIEWSLNIASHTFAKQDCEQNAEPAVVFNQSCLNQGRLWPRGSSIRQSELRYYNPFLNDFTLTERLLGSVFLDEHVPQIIFQNINDFSKLYDAVRKFGKADFIIHQSQIDQISEVVVKLQVEHIEYFGLLIYMRLNGVRRFRGQVLLRVEIAEMVQ